MDRRVVQLLVVLTLALVIAGCGLFQKPDPVKKGTVLGVVSLEGGGPLAGVTVTLDGNSVVTNDGGAFEFSGVPYGTYIITVTVDGEDHSVAVEVKGAQTTAGCIFRRNRPLIPGEADHRIRSQGDQYRSEATLALAV